MAELLTITSPPPQQTTWKVNEIHFNWAAQSIQIGLIGTNNEAKHHSYGSTTATSFMSLCNTKNFTSTSMQKEVLKRLVNDGVIAGTISGTPD
jgi:hypothetical protein